MQTMIQPDMALPPILSPSLRLAPPQRPGTPDAIPAERLFQGSQVILIAHKGETYRLRITRNGKLILTK